MSDSEHPITAHVDEYVKTLQWSADATEREKKLTHLQDIDGGTKRVTAEIAAIITRHLAGTTQEETSERGL